MTAPRRVLEGQFYLVTRRTLLRMFMLRPHPEVNAMFEYCLAEAAARFDIDLIAWCAMSNHYHAVIYDRNGRAPAFIEHFHKMLAKALNRHYGRYESVWSRDQTCLTRLVTLEDVFDKVVYVLTNPAAAHLVDNIVHWPGSSSWDLMGRSKTKNVTRPRYYFSGDGRMPPVAGLRVVAPHGLEATGKSYKKWTERVRAGVELRQEALKKKRKNGVLGRKRVQKMDPFDSPKTEAPRRNLRPHLACKNKKRMTEERLQLRRFRADYRDMRERLREGKRPILFPYGTYRLRLLGLRCEGCPPPPEDAKKRPPPRAKKTA